MACSISLPVRQQNPTQCLSQAGVNWIITRRRNCRAFAASLTGLTIPLVTSAGEATGTLNSEDPIVKQALTRPEGQVLVCQPLIELWTKETFRSHIGW
jgi:hypothetical protein